MKLERRNLNHKATRDVAKRSAFLFLGGGGFIRKAFLPDFQKLHKFLKHIVREYSKFIAGNRIRRAFTIFIITPMTDGFQCLALK